MKTLLPLPNEEIAFHNNHRLISFKPPSLAAFCMMGSDSPAMQNPVICPHTRSFPGKSASIGPRLVFKQTTRTGNVIPTSTSPMCRNLSTRITVAITGLALCLFLAASTPVRGQVRESAPPQPKSTFAPHPQQQQSVRARPNANKPAPNNRPADEHLPEWMSRHSNLTPEQQQKALQAEPGFNLYPPQTQQRLLDRLAQLNAMPPEKRQRLLEHNEWMEHLTPPQRQQVRVALKQLLDLPPDQRRYVDRTFRGLRELSPPQRQAVLNSERFNHLTDAQRASLNSLMQVEPLLPPPYDAEATPVP